MEGSLGCQVVNITPNVQRQVVTGAGAHDDKEAGGCDASRTEDEDEAAGGCDASRMEDKDEVAGGCDTSRTEDEDEAVGGCCTSGMEDEGRGGVLHCALTLSHAAW